MVAITDPATHLSLLRHSSQSRTASPDGNIYFNPDGTLEIITREELAQVDLGAGLVQNPLTNEEAITWRVLYAFERQVRRNDENLRELDNFIEGSFKYSGAYNLVNDRLLSTANSDLGDDRLKIRGSGWSELDSSRNVKRIYFGTSSLGNILSDSQAYYQLSAGGSATDFHFQGPVNQAVQVFGDASNGNFDNTSYLALSVRTWGQTHDRKFLSDSGLSETSGYASGFAISERPNSYHDNYDLNDVWTTPTGNWSGISLADVSGSPEDLPGLIDIDGAVSATGTFNQVIRNPSGASLSELVAWMDAYAINTGRQVETLYTLDANSNVVLQDELYLEDVPVADRSKVFYVDNSGTRLKYQTTAGGAISVGPAAAADPECWYHMFYANPPSGNSFNTLSAETVNDSDGNPIKGLVGGASSISFTFAYDTNTQAGYSAGTNRDVIIEVEGNGGATSKKTTHTITSSASQNIVCEPSAETNI